MFDPDFEDVDEEWEDGEEEYDDEGEEWKQADVDQAFSSWPVAIFFGLFL